MYFATIENTSSYLKEDKENSKISCTTTSKILCVCDNEELTEKIIEMCEAELRPSDTRVSYMTIAFNNYPTEKQIIEIIEGKYSNLKDAYNRNMLGISDINIFNIYDF